MAILLLVFNLRDTALPTKHVEQHTRQDDQEHDSGDGRSHRRVAELKLLPEERAVKQGAHNIRREIRPGVHLLSGIDQVEGVEVPDEGQDADNPDGGQDQRRIPPGG